MSADGALAHDCTLTGFPSGLGLNFEPVTLAAAVPCQFCGEPADRAEHAEARGATMACDAVVPVCGEMACSIRFLRAMVVVAQGQARTEKAARRARLAERRKRRASTS